MLKVLDAHEAKTKGKERSKAYPAGKIGRKKKYSWTLEILDAAKTVALALGIGAKQAVTPDSITVTEDHPRYREIVALAADAELQADGWEITQASPRLGELKKLVVKDPKTKHPKCNAFDHPIIDGTGEAAECLRLITTEDSDEFYIKFN
jgi:hypothetical protein